MINGIAICYLNSYKHPPLFSIGVPSPYRFRQLCMTMPEYVKEEKLYHDTDSYAAIHSHSGFRLFQHKYHNSIYRIEYIKHETLGQKTISFYDVSSPPQKQKQRKNVWLRQDKSKCQREANTNLAIPSR